MDVGLLELMLLEGISDQKLDASVSNRYLTKKPSKDNGSGKSNICTTWHRTCSTSNLPQ